VPVQQRVGRASADRRPVGGSLKEKVNASGQSNYLVTLEQAIVLWICISRRDESAAREFAPTRIALANNGTGFCPLNQQLHISWALCSP
jgi:hypothetical protein